MPKHTITSTIKDFFGYHPNPQAPITADAKGFLMEIKAIPVEERLSMAQLAANNLGYKAEDCEFVFAA